MLARIAHELFWLGRSVARAEHTARMLDGVLQASLQGRPDDPAGVRLGWRSLPTILRARVMLARCLVEARRRVRRIPPR